MFGKVIKAYDHKKSEYVAIKIIRNQSKFHTQAKVEVKLLEYIKANNGSTYNIADITTHFTFRNHVV